MRQIDLLRISNDPVILGSVQQSILKIYGISELLYKYDSGLQKNIINHGIIETNNKNSSFGKISSNDDGFFGSNYFQQFIHDYDKETNLKSEQRKFDLLTFSRYLAFQLEDIVYGRFIKKVEIIGNNRKLEFNLLSGNPDGKFLAVPFFELYPSILYIELGKSYLFDFKFYNGLDPKYPAKFVLKLNNVIIPSNITKYGTINEVTGQYISPTIIPDEMLYPENKLEVVAQIYDKNTSLSLEAKGRISFYYLLQDYSYEYPIGDGTFTDYFNINEFTDDEYFADRTGFKYEDNNDIKGTSTIVDIGSKFIYLPDESGVYGVRVFIQDDMGNELVRDTKIAYLSKVDIQVNDNYPITDLSNVKIKIKIRKDLNFIKAINFCPYDFKLSQDADESSKYCDFFRKVNQAQLGSNYLGFRFYGLYYENGKEETYGLNETKYRSDGTYDVYERTFDLRSYFNNTNDYLPFKLTFELVTDDSKQYKNFSLVSEKDYNFKSNVFQLRKGLENFSSKVFYTNNDRNLYLYSKISTKTNRKTAQFYFLLNGAKKFSVEKVNYDENRYIYEIKDLYNSVNPAVLNNKDIIYSNLLIDETINDINTDYEIYKGAKVFLNKDNYKHYPFSVINSITKSIDLTKPTTAYIVMPIDSVFSADKVKNRGVNQYGWFAPFVPDKYIVYTSEGKVLSEGVFGDNIKWNVYDSNSINQKIGEVKPTISSNLRTKYSWINESNNEHIVSNSSNIIDITEYTQYIIYIDIYDSYNSLSRITKILYKPRGINFIGSEYDGTSGTLGERAYVENTDAFQEVGENGDLLNDLKISTEFYKISDTHLSYSTQGNYRLQKFMNRYKPPFGVIRSSYVGRISKKFFDFRQLINNSNHNIKGKTEFILTAENNVPINNIGNKIDKYLKSNILKKTGVTFTSFKIGLNHKLWESIYNEKLYPRLVVDFYRVRFYDENDEIPDGKNVGDRIDRDITKDFLFRFSPTPITLEEVNDYLSTEYSLFDILKMTMPKEINGSQNTFMYPYPIDRGFDISDEIKNDANTRYHIASLEYLQSETTMDSGNNISFTSFSGDNYWLYYLTYVHSQMINAKETIMQGKYMFTEQYSKLFIHFEKIDDYNYQLVFGLTDSMLDLKDTEDGKNFIRGLELEVIASESQF